MVVVSNNRYQIIVINIDSVIYVNICSVDSPGCLYLVESYSNVLTCVSFEASDRLTGDIWLKIGFTKYTKITVP